MPSQPLPTPKYKYWRQTGVQSKHSCAAWPRTKRLHVFTHGHLPEPVLSIRTCLILSWYTHIRYIRTIIYHLSDGWFAFRLCTIPHISCNFRIYMSSSNLCPAWFPYNFVSYFSGSSRASCLSPCVPIVTSSCHPSRSPLCLGSMSPW